MRKIHNYLKQTGWRLCEDATGITALNDGVQIKIYKLNNPRGFHLYIKTASNSYSRICVNSDEVIDIASKSIRTC